MTTLPTQPAAQPGPLQTDLMTWSMLRTRRQRKVMPSGIDAAANRWIGRARHARLDLGHLRREADAVIADESHWSAMSDRDLDARIEEIRCVFQRRRETREEIRAALGALREVAYRTTDQKPYPVQLMGALSLYHGQIIEMVTGEGKTLTATVAAALMGLSGQPVHVVTVNDYLAQRDADNCGPIYQRCGLGSCAIVEQMSEDERAIGYQTPIVYATAREIMADWLRDQLRLGKITDPISTRWLYSTAWSGRHAAPRALTLVPGLRATIVDEIDAILIDEAVTPLIIAQKGQTNPQAELYQRASELAGHLERRRHFTLTPSERKIELTGAGRSAIEQLVADDRELLRHPIWNARRLRNELVEQALVAHHLYHKGQQYEVLDDKVVIVDEYTGRIMTDRTWQHGLHQAVEAKEGVEISADQQTLASISFQRFFRQYPLLSGMTGTAAEARPELERTYGKPVRIIPTHRPIQRQQWPDVIYRRAADKWDAVVEQIEKLHKKGRPVLVGTRSVEASEILSTLLNRRALDHTVLNAVRHKEEADIIAVAGRKGAITVATNMAGRGTDIKLGPGVSELGGLHVILTERHTARRVDRQFIGRAGRQGDVGSTQTFMSLEDDLLTRFASRLARVLQRRYAGRTDPLPGRLAAAFSHAQRRATGSALRSRLLMIRHDHDLDKMLPG